MKINILILLFSFLTIPVESNGIGDPALAGNIVCEYEENSFPELSQTFFDSLFTENGGDLNGGAIRFESLEEMSLHPLIDPWTTGFSSYCIPIKIPRYIAYCCLKIAC